MISDRYNYIFVHIPKTGGSSIEQILLSEEGVDVSDRAREDLYWIDSLTEELKHRFALGKIDNELYSAQHYTIEMYKNKYKKKFDDYFKFTFVRNPWDQMVSEWKYFNKVLGQNLSLKESLTKFCIWGEHYREQVAFAIGCDFIGRFEKLQKDFEIVCETIGIRKRKLPHMNTGRHRHYTEYYDDETRAIVAEKYARDIEYFGYRFGE